MEIMIAEECTICEGKGSRPAPRVMDGIVQICPSCGGSGKQCRPVPLEKLLGFIHVQTRVSENPLAFSHRGQLSFDSKGFEEWLKTSRP